MGSGSAAVRSSCAARPGSESPRCSRLLLFLVEDAQWLDGPSAEVLGFVARRLELEPVFVLFAVREGIASAVDESGLPELHLDGLDEESSRALLELVAPDLPS